MEINKKLLNHRLENISIINELLQVGYTSIILICVYFNARLTTKLAF